MSSQTIEKKQYPSQLNSKTISARIPVQDYVQFLQDSLSKGISLNDWLLMKIYNTESKIGNDNIDTIKITKEDLYDTQYDFELISKFYDEVFKDDLWEIDKTTVLELLGDLYNNTTQLQNYYDKLSKKVASLADVKTQLTILINNKFENPKDRKELRSELFELLDELS